MSDYQKQARTMKKKADEMNIKLSYQQSLELISVINGYKCWSALKASLDDGNSQIEKTKKKEDNLSIYANIMTTDKEFQFDFDVTNWFEQATDAEIISLIDSNFRGYPARDIANFLKEENDHIESLLNHISCSNLSNEKKISFDVIINSDDVSNWLTIRRNHLLDVKRYTIFCNAIGLSISF